MRIACLETGPGPTELPAGVTRKMHFTYILRRVQCQSGHPRLRHGQGPTENDIFYFGQMTCSDCLGRVPDDPCSGPAPLLSSALDSLS